MTLGNGNSQWRLLREKILMFSGLMLIGATFVAFLITDAFRYEFLATGLTLCGISIAQIGDRKDR